MGHVVVDHSNSQAAVASIQAVSKRLQNGMCIMFFPEGPAGLRKAIYYPSERGAFYAADLQLPVLPMSISGTGHLLPTGSVKWQPGPVKLMIHPPFTQPTN